MSIEGTFESSSKCLHDWTRVTYIRHESDGKFRVDPGFGGYPTMYGAISALDPFQSNVYWPAAEMDAYLGRMGIDA